MITYLTNLIYIRDYSRVKYIQITLKIINKRLYNSFLKGNIKYWELVVQMFGKFKSI